MNHVNALRAFKVTQFAGIGYSRFQNDLVVDYMTQAGFDVVEKLEGDFGVPVVCSAAALSWEIQQRLHVRQPAAGSGRLLAELP